MKRGILCAALLIAAPAFAQTATPTAMTLSPEATLRMRLSQLDSDSRFNGLARFERAQASSAITALENTRSRDLKLHALYIAETRVKIAETAARTQLLDANVVAMDREIADLSLELQRRENARIAAENERLRIEAANREEELRKQREDAARAQAALDQIEKAATTQASAARMADLKLARQEAELVAGTKLPSSIFDSRGEVFTLSGDAFSAATGSTLSAAGKSQLKALTEYIKITTGGAISVLGHTDATSSPLSAARAEAVLAALKSGGVPAARLTAKGLGGSAPVADVATAAGRWKNKRVEVIIANP